MSSDIDRRSLAAHLARDVDGEIRFDEGTRHLYATDASAYRQVPIGVVVPRSIDALVATIAVCREHGAPVTHRGGGTSCAGQATNEAVIVDSSKHLRTITAIDADRRVAQVEPGVVLDDLRVAAERHGLTFAPDPATHNRCTLGGMIGNNACGVHSVVGGRTSDNVEELDVLLYDGTRLAAGPIGEAKLDRLVATDGRHADVLRRLRALRDAYADEIRARFPPIPRRVSGYNLDDLLPDRGFHLGRALVGTEGTCVTVLGATLRLVPSPPYRQLVVLGYPSIVDAADDAPRVLAAGCIGLEGMDHHLADPVTIGPMHARELLPDGDAWLVVEFGAEHPEEAEASARALVDGGGNRWPSARLYDAADAAHVWRIRKSGLATTTFVPGKRPKWTGWEDAAVEPGALPSYLRQFRDLLDVHGLEGSLYGHFGDGCIHSRIDFDYGTEDGVRAYRRFVSDAADLVLAHGGSFSGEHGDGQSRAELLPRLFGDRLVAAFEAFKGVFDPDDKMNPGKVVRPRALDADLRYGPAVVVDEPRTWFAYERDNGSFARAQMRCVGVGLCRRDDGAGTMCPSYMVTRDERHSTRGRARLLHEMLRADSPLPGWDDEATREALELCLSCKGCKADCPVSVDIATYKAEFLSHHYENRRRPPSHYALGLAHRWIRLAARWPGLANRIATSGAGRLGRHLAGVTTRREVPAFAQQSFRAWFAQHPDPSGSRPAVALFVDTFTNHIEPAIARAAVGVLEDAGFRVVVPDDACCGRPLFDCGMLARSVPTLLHLASILDAYASEGIAIVGLEPSCVSVLRAELTDLLPDDGAARRVAAATRTLAEFLVDVGYTPPRLLREAIVHGHCHEKADIGLTATATLYDAVGLRWRELDAGCCGLAGSFGYEAGEKYDVSVAVGERKLLPAVRATSPETLVIADGFSCRSQIQHLHAGRRALHTAEVLDLARRTGPDGPRVTPIEEASPSDAPAAAETRQLAALAAVVAASAAGLAALRRLRR